MRHTLLTLLAAAGTAIAQQGAWEQCEPPIYPPRLDLLTRSQAVASTSQAVLRASRATRAPTRTSTIRNVSLARAVIKHRLPRPRQAWRLNLLFRYLRRQVRWHQAEEPALLLCHRLLQLELRSQALVEEVGRCNMLAL